MEKRYFHKRGHAIWIVKSGSLVRDAEDRPLHFVAQVEDITPRKRVEQALMGHARRLEQAHRAIEAQARELGAEDGRTASLLFIKSLHPFTRPRRPL